MRGGLELDSRNQLLAEPILPDDAVLNQHIGIAFHEPFEFFVFEEEADDDVVDDEQRRRADDSAGHAVVVADDGVLHRVRQGEQHDQIQRVQLRQLAFTGDAEPGDQEEIDRDGPQHLFRNGQPENEHVMQRLHHAAIV